MASRDLTRTRKLPREFATIAFALALTLFVVIATLPAAAPSHASPEAEETGDSASMFDDPTLDAAHRDLISPEGGEVSAPAVGEDSANVAPEGEALDGVDAPEELMGAMRMASPRSLTQAGAFRCTPGTFYAINDQGFVYEVNNTLGGFTSVGAGQSDIRFGPPNASPYQMNGLAIGANGEQAYAFARTNGAVRIYDWKSPNGRASRSVSWVNWDGAIRGNEPFGPDNFIAGGAHPTEDTGYYFGGYSQATTTRTITVSEGRWETYSDYGWVWNSRPRIGYNYDNYRNWVYTYWPNGRYLWQERQNRRWIPPVTQQIQTTQYRFNLFKYLRGSGAQYLGYVPVYQSTTPTRSANGDLAFDEEGNLFLLFHDGVRTVRIVPVMADNLRKAESGLNFGDFSTRVNYEIPAQNVTDLRVDVPQGTEFNGLAFNYDGNLIVENSSSGSPATMRLVDPGTGTVIRSTTLPSSGWAYGTDLASCNGFPTVELKKNVVGRVKDSDQFRLEILREVDSFNQRVVASAETEGTDNGVQGEQAGPVSAASGKVYRVRETGIAQAGSNVSPADLDNYDVTLRCIDKSINRPISVTQVRGAKHEWQFTVPNAANFSVPQISCTYSNEPIVTEVAWTKLGEKSDGTDPAPLGGTVWNLKRTDAAGKESNYEITDCGTGGEGATCPEGKGVDTDPKPGKFKVTQLPHGKYELTEKETPEGYIRLEKPITFDLNKETAAKRTLDLGQILNKLERGELTWTKTDSDGKALAGSEWTLKGPEDKRIKVTDNLGQDGYVGVDTDTAPGKFKVKDLHLGTYTLEETKAPDGYVKGNTQITTLEITPKTLKLTFGEIKNTPNRIDWTKVDSKDNSPLGGSEWTLKKSGSTDAPTVIADCVSEGCSGPDTNPAPGQFSLEAVPAGTYELYESQAPAGYDRDETRWTLKVTEDGFELSAEGKTTTAGKFLTTSGADSVHLGKFENTAITGVLMWQKVGQPYVDQPDTVVLLGESEWELVPVSGNVGEVNGKPMKIEDCVAESESGCAGLDKDPTAGKFAVKDLPLGWYRLVETKAPLGFLKDETEHYVEITNEKRTVEIGQIKNELVDTQTLPKTGGMGVLPLIVLGGLITIGGAYIARRKA